MGVNVNTSSTTDVISKLSSLWEIQGDPVTAQKTNRSFVFSQYYVQNVEVTLRLNVGAALNTVLTMNTKEETPQMVVPFITNSDGNGIFKLSGEGAFIRQYDSTTDRVTYIADCDATTGSIQMTFGVSMAGIIDTSIDLDTQYNILAINSNISIVVNPGNTLTLKSDMKLLPEATIDVKQGGNLVLDGCELYIYDKADWLAGSYAYSADLHQVHYVATRNAAPVSRSIGESANINVDGTITIQDDAYLFTTVGYTRNGATTSVADAGNVDKVLTGSGKAVINSVYPETASDDFGKLDEFEFGTNNWTVTHLIETTTVVGKLAGVTDGTAYKYNSFDGSGATYYGLGPNYDQYWYQYTISVADGKRELPK